ncbi:MAG: PaaI family thioesterase [Alphaproteobacteria bacterium]
MSERTELSAQQTEFFKHLQSGNWEDMPVGLKNLGIKPHEWLKEVSYGRTRYEWPNTGDRDIGDGRVFGGWIAALSDHIVSMTMASALEDGEWFTTMELTNRMFRPIQKGTICVEAKLINRGRTQGFVEADWTDDRGKLLVRTSAVKAIRTFDQINVQTGN